MLDAQTMLNVSIKNIFYFAIYRLVGKVPRNGCFDNSFLGLTKIDEANTNAYNIINKFLSLVENGKILIITEFGNLKTLYDEKVFEYSSFTGDNFEINSLGFFDDRPHIFKLDDESQIKFRAMISLYEEMTLEDRNLIQAKLMYLIYIAVMGFESIIDEALLKSARIFQGWFIYKYANNLIRDSRFNFESNIVEYLGCETFTP